ncbi:unnamed protein product [Symbiodinium necroappetens]|uniref:Uncharacterized protein n=1 Tax=Symbiodinium necroappetens TaxID=1628268 RepID=A0A812KNV2_9DINO|nr:unnamed protein product [Symbiodinium necroappetens]
MSGKADKKGKAAVHFCKAACVMERFIAEAGTTRNRPQPENRAVLDPLKPDLNAWLQKYMKSDFLRKHPDLQDLQLILRRQLMTKNAVTTRRQLQDVSSG